MNTIKSSEVKIDGGSSSSKPKYVHQYGKPKPKQPELSDEQKLAKSVAKSFVKKANNKR